MIAPHEKKEIEDKIRLAAARAEEDGEDDRLQQQQQQQQQRQQQMQESRQSILLSSERFAIPELLFAPSNNNVVMGQPGLPEAIVQSVQASHSSLWKDLYCNIVVVGGGANFRGFRDRLNKELRTLVDSKYEINIVFPDNPIEYATEGAIKVSLTDVVGR